MNNFNYKKDFPIYNRHSDLVYLDFSSSAQTPNVVMNAMDAYYRECRANVYRGMYPLSLEATQRLDRARKLTADFLHAKSAEIIFTRGTTESLNLLAYSLTQGLKAGDEIVITALEHHANFVPWQQMAKEKKLVLKFIELTPEFELDLVDAKQKITNKTKIVAASFVSNVLGTVLPIKELVDLAHQVGAVLVVDAAQAAGHRPIDVADLNCDFLALSGHKMYGPTGIGVLYGKETLLKKLPPFMFGGDMIREVHRESSAWNDVPNKFEAGTPNIAGAIGLGAAVEYLGGIGLEKIQNHENKLTDYALKKLQEVSGIKVIGPKLGTDRAGVISFVLEGVHPHDIADLLGSQNICVRAGHHCAMPLMESLGLVNGTTRLSLGLTSTKEDIDRLVEELGKINSIFNKT